MSGLSFGRNWVGLHPCAFEQLASFDDDLPHAGLQPIWFAAMGTSFYKRAPA
jgi:hypothetical protein